MAESFMADRPTHGSTPYATPLAGRPRSRGPGCRRSGSR